MSKIWSHIIVEAYCFWDFAKKKPLSGPLKGHPIKECQKIPGDACLGTAKKCPYLGYAPVSKLERSTMLGVFFALGKASYEGEEGGRKSAQLHNKSYDRLRKAADKAYRRAIKTPDNVWPGLSQVVEWLEKPNAKKV